MPEDSHKRFMQEVERIAQDPNLKDLGEMRAELVRLLRTCQTPTAAGTAYAKAFRIGWPEDASHENGSYFNTCSICGEEFIGYKRRVVCKPCAKSVTVLNLLIEEVVFGNETKAWKDLGKVVKLINAVRDGEA